MKTPKISLFILLSIFSLNLHSQILYDYSRFHNPQKPFIEVYYGFPNSCYNYKDTSISFILVNISNLTNKNIVNQVYELNKNKNSFDYNIDQITMGYINDEFKLSFIGLNQKKIKVGLIDSTMIKIQDPSGHFSDIQLSYSAKKSNEQTSPFYKNGIEVTPNPGNYYNSSNTKLYFYYEYYKEQNYSDDSLKLTVKIYDKNSIEKMALNRQKKANSIITDVSGFDISSLENGKYSLKITAFSKSNLILDEVSKTFFVGLNTKTGTQSNNSANQLSIILGKMNSEELGMLFSKLSFIATDQEKQIFKKLNSESDKQKFVEKFINIRAEDKTDPFIYYQQYLDNIEIVDNKFSTQFIKGYKTDRGIIYLKYGAPSDIEKNVSSGESKPYEIWSYNDIEGGVIFVFGDKSENGTYELIHSTKRGELSNENWKSLLQYNTR